MVFLDTCATGVSVSAEDTVLFTGHNEGRLASRLTHLARSRRIQFSQTFGIRSQFLKGSWLVLLNVNGIWSDSECSWLPSEQAREQEKASEMKVIVVF